MSGVLIEVDPAIKAIILKIDSDNNHEYIIEDLDDGILLIKENRQAEMKAKLESELAETQLQLDESGSEAGG